MSAHSVDGLNFAFRTKNRDHVAIHQNLDSFPSRNSVESQTLCQAIVSFNPFHQVSSNAIQQSYPIQKGRLCSIVGKERVGRSGPPELIDYWLKTGNSMSTSIRGFRFVRQRISETVEIVGLIGLQAEHVQSNRSGEELDAPTRLLILPNAGRIGSVDATVFIKVVKIENIDRVLIRRLILPHGRSIGSIHSHDDRRANIVGVHVADGIAEVKDIVGRQFGSCVREDCDAEPSIPDRTVVELDLNACRTPGAN